VRGGEHRVVSSRRWYTAQDIQDRAISRVSTYARYQLRSDRAMRCNLSVRGVADEGSMIAERILRVCCWAACGRPCILGSVSVLFALPGGRDPGSSPTVTVYDWLRRHLSPCPDASGRLADGECCTRQWSLVCRSESGARRCRPMFNRPTLRHAISGMGHARRVLPCMHSPV